MNTIRSVLSRRLVLLVAVSALVSPSVRADARAPRRSAMAPGANAFRAPSAGATLIAGSMVEARWILSSDALGRADEAELVLLVEGGPVSVVRLSPELSPRDVTYRFRVPSLVATSVRLALRVGSDRGRDRERLVLIGDAFTIAPGDASGGLVRGSDEWWTQQALFESTVRDLLQESVEEDGERLVSPRGETEADRPTAAPAPVSPSASSTNLPERAAVSAASAGLPAATSVSTPLRL